MHYEKIPRRSGENACSLAMPSRIFQRNGKFYEPGEIFRQPELARTLERIAANPKANEFYKGAMARELAAEIKRGGGLITAEDLAEYEVKERRPITWHLSRL